GPTIKGPDTRLTAFPQGRQASRQRLHCVGILRRPNQGPGDNPLAVIAKNEFATQSVELRGKNTASDLLRQFHCVRHPQLKQANSSFLFAYFALELAEAILRVNTTQRLIAAVKAPAVLAFPTMTLPGLLVVAAGVRTKAQRHQRHGTTVDGPKPD